MKNNPNFKDPADPPFDRSADRGLFTPRQKLAALNARFEAPVFNPEPAPAVLFTKRRWLEI